MFVLSFDHTYTKKIDVVTDSPKRVTKTVAFEYFLPRVNINNYNVLINQIKKYNEIRNIATGQGHDYAKGWFLDCKYFKDHYQWNTVNLSKQKELDAIPRAIQQIEFYRMLDTNSQVCTILEKSKETV